MTTQANYRQMTTIPPHIVHVAKQNTPIDEIPIDIKWSNVTTPVPAIGEIIRVRINRIGPARVERYFVEHNFLGLLVTPFAPPEWYVKQNGRGSTCHVFGTEIDPLEADPLNLRVRVRVARIRGLDRHGFLRKTADRYVVKVYRNADNGLLLDGSQLRTTPELAFKLAEKFCQKNGLVIFNVEFPS
jgi:hypothetical protein